MFIIIYNSLSFNYLSDIINMLCCFLHFFCEYMLYWSFESIFLNTSIKANVKMALWNMHRGSGISVAIFFLISVFFFCYFCEPVEYFSWTLQVWKRKFYSYIISWCLYYVYLFSVIMARVKKMSLCKTPT